MSSPLSRNFLGPPHDHFDQNAGKWCGASDDNNCVQWNIGIDRESGETYLGVNLEGMKHKNWPITNLLLADINAAEEITVNLTRDAWQAAARSCIKERLIDGSGTTLKSMSPPLWEKMVKEALECLNLTSVTKVAVGWMSH